MTTSEWTEADTRRALEIWVEYQKQHDVSDRRGQTVAIDPATGRMWFGDPALEIWEEMEREGVEVPTYMVRVGYDYYLRKGGHR